jgi:hypothetical protein
MDTSFLRKKVGGVPVLYIAALLVAILAVVAWKLNPSAPTEGDDATPDEEGDAAGDPANADYSGFATNGTVTVQQGTDPATVSPVVVQTNERWATNASNWLVAQGLASGTVAQTATRKYIDGESLSTAEGKLIDAATKQFGVPPEPLTAGGVTADPIAAAIPRKQGPLPRLYKNGTAHIVRNTAENDFYKLAKLYYGSDHYDYVNFLEVANLSYPKGHNTLRVGDAINIPTYTPPKYYVTYKAGMTADEIAAKNSTTAAAIREFNDNTKFPVTKGGPKNDGKGTKLRVK